MQSITVSDITMKIADETAAFSLSFKEKIELAKLLDKLNVSVIEIGAIQSRKIDSLLIKSIAAAVKHGVVAVPVTLDPESVELTWAALKEAKAPRLQLKAPMSAAQMEYFCHKKPPQMLSSIDEIIRSCKKLCADVEFIADDACRSEAEFLYSAIRTAIAAGATGVTICDAAGLMFPDEFTAFIKGVQENVPEIAGVRLGVLCSDSLSMASACALAAVRAGAQEIKVMSCSGNITQLGEFAAILKNRGDAIGASGELRYTEIKRILDQVEWLCKSTRSKTSPFDTGVEDGANSAEVVLSAQDDLPAVLKAVEKIGYDLSEEDGIKVFEAFQRIVGKKGSVSAKELDTIVASAAMQVPPTYRLVNYVINCGNIIAASAQIRLEKNGETLEGIYLGDGPVDASFLAIEQVIGHHYELDDFQIQAVTEGREAMGNALVRLRSNGKLYSGRGTSTDVLGASIHAYINALNKIVYEEAEA